MTISPREDGKSPEKGALEAKTRHEGQSVEPKILPLGENVEELEGRFGEKIFANVGPQSRAEIELVFSPKVQPKTPATWAFS